MDDLNKYALSLLKFVEDNVHEAIAEPASRQALLAEGNCGLRILGRTLHRHDEHIFGKWALIINDTSDLERIGKDNLDDPKEPLLAALNRILITRYLFGVPRPDIA